MMLSITLLFHSGTEWRSGPVQPRSRPVWNPIPGREDIHSYYSLETQCNQDWNQDDQPFLFQVGEGCGYGCGYYIFSLSGFP